MSDIPLVLRLLADTTEAESQIKALDAQVDETVGKWKASRQEIINGLSSLNQSINYTFQALRLAARATGQTIAPIHNALMGVISGTTSLMLATATLISAESFGVLAGVGVALAAFALGFQIAETAKLTAEMIAAREGIAEVENSVQVLRSQIRVSF